MRANTSSGADMLIVSDRKRRDVAGALRRNGVGPRLDEGVVGRTRNGSHRPNRDSRRPPTRASASAPRITTSGRLQNGCAAGRLVPYGCAGSRWGAARRSSAVGCKDSGGEAISVPPTPGRGAIARRLRRLPTIGLFNASNLRLNCHGADPMLARPAARPVLRRKHARARAIGERTPLVKARRLDGSALDARQNESRGPATDRFRCRAGKCGTRAPASRRARAEIWALPTLRVSAFDKGPVRQILGACASFPTLAR